MYNVFYTYMYMYMYVFFNIRICAYMCMYNKYHSFFLLQSQPINHHNNITLLVDFALALYGKLDIVNKHSFNNFELRVG